MQLTDALYTYTVDEKGVYTLTVAGAFDVYGDNSEMGAGYGRMDGKTTGLFSHKAKTAYLANNTTMETVVNVSESTKFVCKGADGTWKSFTGYTALPALSARFLGS